MYNSRASDAIRHFHSLIESDTQRSEQNYQQLQERQREEGVLFGERPLSQSLRPTLLTEDAYSEIQDATYQIRQAIIELARCYFDQEKVLSELGITEWERELINIPTNVIRMSATARFDSFMTGDTFKFVEINGESPAGAGYLSILSGIYQELDLFREFTKKFPVRYVDPLQHLVHGLLRIYRDEFGGKALNPRFAIVDFPDLPTSHEFRIVQRYLKRFNMDAIIVDPRKTECKDGWLWAHGKRIDIAYRRVLANELQPVLDESKGFMNAYRKQKTCFLNTFRSKLVHKKSIFSLLTDPDYNHILTGPQLKAIERHIPWTRKLTYRTTRRKQKKIDLIDYVRNNRDELVIKPNDEYGGKGVVLGHDVSAAKWEEAIESGIRSGDVVQDRVQIQREPFVLKKDGGWKQVNTIVDLAPYLNGPLVGGCLSRTASQNLANVTSGGGSLPVYMLRFV